MQIPHISEKVWPKVMNRRRKRTESHCLLESSPSKWQIIVKKRKKKEKKKEAWFITIMVNHWTWWPCTSKAIFSETEMPQSCFCFRQGSIVTLNHVKADLYFTMILWTIIITVYFRYCAHKSQTQRNRGLYTQLLTVAKAKNNLTGGKYWQWITLY